MLRLSIVIPSYNSGRFIGATLESIFYQELPADVELEVAVIDGGSNDDTLAVIERWREQLSDVISEPDKGPADAINKGFELTSGELFAWINADDTYQPGTLLRAIAAYRQAPTKGLYFGRCRIVDEGGEEIRRAITAFKELFFPLSCRVMIQTINYISQPATFFRRQAWQAAGGLRLDMVAAFDYELILRLWRQGGARRIRGEPLSNFRWHEGSISGQNFETQFREEWQAAVADAGRWSPQALAHWLVRHAIVVIYSGMARRRARIAARSG